MRTPMIRWLAAAACLTSLVIAAAAPMASAGSGPVPAGSIGSRELANNDVRGADIATNAVGRGEIRRDAVGSSEIIDGSVRLAELEVAARSHVKLAYNDAETVGSGLDRTMADMYLPGGTWTVIGKATITSSPGNTPTVTCGLRLEDAGPHQALDETTVRLPSANGVGDGQQITLITVTPTSSARPRMVLWCRDPGNENATASNVRLLAFRTGRAWFDDDTGE